ncbi:MAG: cob(I)yrinic acid a,c-diamide adenosyltransferase, partial [Verrucomicrobia bacterium]|nr:cob(I)yrinic acid a,c-diamide adenosyltransferase [Verrucomicrobiota bacterium]
MRITRVYTRTGDLGETGLAGGQRVAKDSLRVECYGTVDELNSALGVARAFNDDPELEAVLCAVQNELFGLSSVLCVLPPDRMEGMPAVGDAEVRRLEELMDRCQAELKPLEEFILPDGGKVPSLLHLARTICRRAERLCVRLAREEPAPGETAVVKYLNRLGDALFVL